MNAERLAERLAEWLRGQVESSDARGLVFGLSGGVDSACVAVLARRACRDEHLALIMPVGSDPRDREDALLVVDKFKLHHREIGLDETYRTMAQALAGKAPDKPDLALANLKARLRMAALYFFANRQRYLVVGTGNRSELTVGYFTKYGDGGVDLLPLGHLVKADVEELAGALGVPQSIVQKPPTAGLVPGQTDAAELGFTYEELDAYLLGQASEDLAARIDELRRKNAHKLRTPRMPPSFSEG